MGLQSVSIALAGSGGAGAMTAGQTLLDAAAKAGLFGLMSRTTGPQIRGGEAAALVRLGTTPIDAAGDSFDILVAFDWQNVHRFAAELPLGPSSVIITDPAEGDIPEIIKQGAQITPVPLKDIAKGIPGGRVNMVGLGVVTAMIGMPTEALIEVVGAALKKKGAEAMAAATACIQAGAAAGAKVAQRYVLSAPTGTKADHWNISGNEAAAVGALRAGVRFCAAYPITPATEVLEALAPMLPKVGGVLVQAEDEIASINMCLGASFGGVPSVTATAGPGLSLMIEGIGLGVASETPVVVIDVARVGPSTGIATKSEQSDLNIAVYGLHGDAPHLVVAPQSIGDCLLATQWAVHLAEALQCPAILLTDQAMGQSRAIISRPADVAFLAKRVVAESHVQNYKRYAVTANGVSPMAIPGTPGGEHTADGLEHAESGSPSSQASDHHVQLDKRNKKLVVHDYGQYWAELEGSGEIAVLAWGSTVGPAREAIARFAAKGGKARLIAPRLLAPALPKQMGEALKGVKRVLVVEQSHSEQFHHYLRAHYDLPSEVKVMSRPGPLPIRPVEIESLLSAWS